MNVYTIQMHACEASFFQGKAWGYKIIIIVKKEQLLRSAYFFLHRVNVFTFQCVCLSLRANISILWILKIIYFGIYVNIMERVRFSSFLLSLLLVFLLLVILGCFLLLLLVMVMFLCGKLYSFHFKFVIIIQKMFCVFFP